LNHPNICTIYDVGEQDGLAFIAMEYLEGSTLKARIADGRDLDIDALLTIGIEIADALDTAHASGSSIAISSRPTSLSARVATPRFWTSAWPRWKARQASGGSEYGDLQRNTAGTVVGTAA
jgi:serine/threonine protein kinase